MNYFCYHFIKEITVKSKSSLNAAATTTDWIPNDCKMFVKQLIFKCDWNIALLWNLICKQTETQKGVYETVQNDLE